MIILPSPKLIVLLLVPAVVVTVYPTRPLITGMLIYDLALLLIALMDLSWSVRPGQVVINRELPAHLSLGADNKVGWEIRNLSRFPVTISITEDIAPELHTTALPVSVNLRDAATAHVQYLVQPTRRGQFNFGPIDFKYPTRLGLIIRQHHLSRQQTIKVYPNVANLARYELAAHRHRLAELGLASSRQRGKGGEFESLRDYTPGDDLADISWKSTAHRGRLVTRNYETERSQNIFLVLDCGRLMTTQIDALSRLDYAINASLLLTYIAIKQHDNVGMVAFSETIESYMPMMKGRAALMRMNEALYRLEPRLCEPDYARACRFLGLQQRKRSLIIIFTDVIDTEASSTLLAHMARFARYHLPICVTFRNLEVEAIANSYPERSSDCYRKSVALQMLERRSVALARMKQSGVDVLDAHPLTLTPNLIERYISVKNKCRL